MPKWRRIVNIVTTVLIIIALFLAVTLVGVRVFGPQVFSVISGSMEPLYPTGSLIYVKTVNYMELKEGNVITFMLDADTVATHRIVKVQEDPDNPGVVRFRTKGDASDKMDSKPVHYRNVIGKPVFSIPYLGYVSHFIQTQSPGNLCVRGAWGSAAGAGSALGRCGGGTVAWLVATTADVKNTFTTSDIKITLTETTGEEYQMIPGYTIKKDPTAAVLSELWLYFLLQCGGIFGRIEGKEATK